MTLRPGSPVAGMVEKIEAERVSGDQLRTWLEEDNPLLRLGMADVTGEDRARGERLEEALRRVLGDEVYKKMQEEAIDLVLGRYRENPQQVDPQGEDRSGQRSGGAT